MGEPAAVETSPRKIKKSRWGPKIDNVSTETNTMENKLTEEPQKVISNGTGNGISENSPEEATVMAKQKTIKITKITKTTKTSKTKEAVRLIIKEGPHSTPCDSPTSSKSVGESFQGFDSEALSEQQLKKQEALQRVLVNLKTSENASSSGGSSAEELDAAIEESDAEGGDMTVDTDSDQMEIDMDNDKEADSVEFSGNGTGKQGGDTRTRDSDVEIIEIKSVKSGGAKSSKSQKVEKTDNKVTNSSILESTLKGGSKTEYCGGCAAEVDDAEDGICCDGECERWFHLRCSGLSQVEYDELGLDENAKWACSKCSGSPLSLPNKSSKPLLTVRKDLGTLSTPSPKRRSLNKEGRTPRVDISNPAFLKPFDFGWKRELVYRSTNDSQNRRQGDIYYYTPKGKKLRSLREISDYLIGTDLTQDNFTFWKEPLGIEDPDKEIIRDAKFKLVNKDSLASSGLPKKLTPKITKLPKPVPKLTATVTPLDSSNSSLLVTPKASASVTPRVVLKKPSTGPKFKVTPSKTSSPGQTQKIAISKDKKKRNTSDDELEMGMLPPMWEPLPKPKDKSAGVKRPLEGSEGPPQAKRPKREDEINYMQNFVQYMSIGYDALLHAFQYLKVQELLRASRVCHLWRDIALHRSLWETVRMKNSQVKDWEGFAATLRNVGTKHLDLRKILMPDKPEALKAMWTDCIKALSKVNSLVKLDLCRCTSYLLEQIAAVCPQLEYMSAGAIKSNQINLTNLGHCLNLTELKLKGQGGIEVSNVSVLVNLTKLKQLSLTMVKNMSQVLEVVGKMTQLESLELGDLMSVTETDVKQAFSQLTRLRRLRLEKGQQDCPTEAILDTLSQLPSLVQLELINFDVKGGFEESMGRCSNIKILLIIPTYVTQSATTNHLVMEAVTRLSKTLNHFVWGLTLELLRVTDLFIDQWEMGQKNAAGKSPNQTPQKKTSGDSIPILKPDGKKAKEGAVTQVDVLQLPKLHKVLSQLLPTTKIIILKVPFSATWRQTISGSNQ